MSPATEGGEPGPVETAVLSDLAPMPESIRTSGVAAIALDQARRLDGLDSGTQPTAASMLAAQLRTTLLELARLAPPLAEEDGVDELRARRAQRLA